MGLYRNNWKVCLFFLVQSSVSILTTTNRCDRVLRVRARCDTKKENKTKRANRAKGEETKEKSTKEWKKKEFAVRFSTFCFYCYGIFEIVIHRVIITYEATKFIFCSFCLSVLAFFISILTFFFVLFVSMFCLLTCLTYTFCHTSHHCLGLDKFTKSAPLLLTFATHQASFLFGCLGLFCSLIFLFLLFFFLDKTGRAG